MTVTSTDAQTPAAPTVPDLSIPRRWQGALAFEATKLFAVRSTWISLGIAVVLQAGLAMLFGWSAKASAENGFDAAAAPAPHLAFQSILITQFLIIVVATLFLTSEYASRSITTTLQSVPVRGRMLASKLTVIALTAGVAGLVLQLIGTLVAWAFAGSYGAFTAGELIGGTLAAGGYLALLAMLVLGLGAALRNAAGTITSALFLLLVLPQALPLFGVDWLTKAANYLPTNAAIVLGMNADQPYGPGVALLLLCGWAAAGIVAGALVLHHRDT